jgi:hypothetical protein
MRRFILIIAAAAALTLSSRAQVIYTTVARTGQTVPQTGGLTAYRFSAAVINNAGQVATDLSYDRSSVKHALTLFPSPGVYNPVAFQGSPAPGADDGATFGSGFSSITLNDPGQVHFKNFIGADLTKDESLFTTPNPLSASALSMYLTAREGYPAPGALPAGTLLTRVAGDNAMITGAILGDGGHVAFISGLSGGGTTTTNPRALFAGSPAGPSLVVRQGDPTPHPGFDYSFDFFSNLTINPVGQVAFRSSLRSNTTTYSNGGIFVATPQTSGAPYAVNELATLRENPPGASTAYTSFSIPSVNAAGDVAFTGDVGSTSAPNNFLLIGRPGSLKTVAHTGDLLPSAGVTPNRIFDPLLSTNGAITFQATLAGADTAHDAALFSGLPGKLRLVAREGDPTPAGPDTFFGDFVSLDTRKFSVNGHGQVAFAATLTGPGVVPATSKALFATDRTGQLMLVARYGQSYDAGDGDGPKTAGTWFAVSSSNANDGLPSAFNDAGQLLYTLTFNSGTPTETSALVRAAIPLPGDATGDGIVDISDFKTLFHNLDKPGAQSQGDFDHNGMVDFADFQLLERWFGHTASDTAIPVSAADTAALDAFAQSIPEPMMLFPLLFAPLLLRRRY